MSECLTKLPENVSKVHFPFLSFFFLYHFLSPHSSMVATRLNRCTYECCAVARNCEHEIVEQRINSEV